MYTIRRIVPKIFYLLTGLSVAASSMTLYSWYRQYTLFFGIHTVSTSTIAVSILACMAIGSFFTGKLADKSHQLTIYVALSGIAAAYILFHPFLFRLMTVLFHKSNQLVQQGPFGIEILRLLLSFLFLFIPAGIMAGSFTLLIRYFIRHTAQTGRYMSAVLVSGSTGIVTGTILSSFYLIPDHNYRVAELIAALIFLIVAVITVLFQIRKKSGTTGGHVPVLARRVKKASLRFRKRKTVLETGAKLKRALIRVYAFQGFTMTAYLLICFRILAYYSEIKTVYFQSLVITVLFSGMALGSSLFRRISERPVNGYLTMATYQILTGFAAIFSYAVLFITQKLEVFNITENLTFSGVLVRHILLYASLILLPAVIMGLSLPLAGKLYPRQLQRTGRSFGRLGFIWLLSALSGIVLTRFILIPLAGLYYAYFTLALLVILSGIYLILRDSRLIRGFRLGYAVFSILIYVLIIGIFKKHAQPVEELEGSATSVSAMEKSDGTLSVRLNNHFYFSSDRDGILVQQFPAYLSVLMNANIHSALVMGFGMGTTASVLDDNGVSAIHIAEIFPEIIRFSSDVFADANDDIMTSSHVDITIEDPRSYLSRIANKVDLITTGCNGPDWMPNNFTTEFYRICLDKLSLNGLICQLLPTRGITANEFRALVKSCSDVFPQVSIWYLTPENLLMVGDKNPEKPALCKFSTLFSGLKNKAGLSAIGITNVEELVARLFLDDGQIREFVNNSTENSDNDPWVQYGRKTGEHADQGLMNFLVNVQADYSDFFQEQDNCGLDIEKTIEKIRQLNESLRQELVLFSGSE